MTLFGGYVRKVPRWARMPSRRTSRYADDRCRGPDGDAAAVAAEITPAHVVEENDENVRASSPASDALDQPTLGEGGLVREDEGVLRQLAMAGFLEIHGQARSS
jgi:hypothetical protein